jgi:hypothetical protein
MPAESRVSADRSVAVVETMTAINVPKPALYVSTLNRLFEQSRYLAGGLREAEALRRESRTPADRWEIGFDLVSVGPFDSEAAAIQSAIKAAFNAGKQNPAGSEVLVQQADGTLRVVWAFGNDPAPT